MSGMTKLFIEQVSALSWHSGTQGITQTELSNFKSTENELHFILN